MNEPIGITIGDMLKISFGMLIIYIAFKGLGI
ncbi:hypothetical protein LCGC14_0593170 [marine sediment metagenome]|uniref:Uncharacterized protein n=1 Tax=marine sediment metagenome TaxID=412755 RepID=A0A0F9RHQ6_9ZZZZ